jgi:ATP-dependent Clp protease adaptor protein ClpS
VEPPPLYRVLLINDDFTPMEFVVLVLVKIFHCSEEKAVSLMLQVHHEGRAICGIFTKDVAQTKVEWVRKMAQEHDHPLICEWEIHS